jgi:hypothetical protein
MEYVKFHVCLFIILLKIVRNHVTPSSLFSYKIPAKYTLCDCPDSNLMDSFTYEYETTSVRQAYDKLMKPTSENFRDEKTVFFHKISNFAEPFF